MKPQILLIIAGIGLAGCADLEESLRPPPKPEPTPAEPLDYHPGESAIWCYETLAEPDCFSGPQGRPPNTLIENYPDRTGSDS